MNWYEKYKREDARQLRAYAREMALRKGTVMAAEQIAEEEALPFDEAVMVVLLACGDNEAIEERKIDE